MDSIRSQVTDLASDPRTASFRKSNHSFEVLASSLIESLSSISFTALSIYGFLSSFTQFGRSFWVVQLKAYSEHDGFRSSAIN